MKQRLISLLLAFVMIITLLPLQAFASETAGPAADDNPFVDVKQGAWYYDSVQYVRVNHIFYGTSETTFDPDGPMTRGMFVTVLGRMAGINPDDYAGSSEFTDVPENAYYAPSVAWAAKHGIAFGIGGGEFSPDTTINRQQMAAFFVRYFEAFDVKCETGTSVTTTPADFDSVSPWARDAVLKLWQIGLLVGSDGNFSPNGSAARSQAAAICYRADEAVDTWFSEPGVPSKREKVDPFGKKPQKPEEDDDPEYYSVDFYDDSRLIDTLYVLKGDPLKEVPAVEKSSKQGAILLGYYVDPEFTVPFYAEEPVNYDMRVYAKYQDMGSTEALNFTTFTQMDQSPNISFRIRRAYGNVPPHNAATLIVKDGSETVKLSVAEDKGIYTVSAADGFNPGSSYELVLAEGWVFDGKPATIRTASFSIYKDEVANIRMGRDVKYLEDTDGINYTVSGNTYEVLTSGLVTEEGGSFTYGGEPALSKDDILCVYVGTHPNDRNSKDGKELLDPAVYVKVSDVSGNNIRFEPLDEKDQVKLYDVPDNFPLLVDGLPGGENGSANIDKLDISMYENMMGKDDGKLDNAKERINVGDFVTLYAGAITNENDLYFGEITEYDAQTGEIAYKQTTKQAILDSMELYQKIDVAGSDLVSPEQQKMIAASVQADLDNSGFGDQAAYLLADLVMNTDQFQNDQNLQEFLTARANRAMASPGAAQLYARDGMTLDRGSVVVKARLVTNGSQLHFNGGVQLAVDVKAKFNAPIGNSLSNTLSIDLGATFVQEVAVRPTVKGGLVYKEILFIPIPIGVEVGASIDVKNYTAMSFDAEISTHDNSGVLYSTNIISDLKDMMNTSEKTGLSDAYQNSLDALMAKYSEMLFQETDWITLVEEDIFQAEYGIYAIGIGIQGDFVVKTDMSIAIGSSLEYEMGKRYEFWFKIGLFTPTAGSSTMDLIDESFAFRFYVMGKLGIRAGVKLTIYAQVGCGKLAKAGISADLGPYVKLYGFFIYEVSKYRPKGSSRWNYNEQMAGALFLEFGLYVTLSFEAEALSFFEYSYDFLDEEFPLLTAGDKKYFYGFSYKPMEDESVIIRDDDKNLENGISMVLPDRVRELSYITLNTGMRGSMPLARDRYHFTVSNPNFTYDVGTGAVSVTVPKYTHYMECDLTITYLLGKMAFSTYDMSVTIPLVWTDLSDRELKEYFVASVRVGNNTDGYETVWSKKVLRGQPFDLPTDEQIKELINFNSTKYSGAGGYAPGQQMKELSVYTDTMYDYKVEYQTYNLTVSGIQNPDGSTTSKTFSARYGQTFDFSSLKNTGTEIPGVAYTRFTNVTAEGVDLSQPINGAMAAWLSGGGTAVANYIDDSVTAVFTFSGITREDITVKVRKGAMPTTGAVTEAVAEIGADDNVGIQAITPELGNIDRSTNYIVTCVKLTGERADVSFDRNFGRPDAEGSEEPAPSSKLVGSLIVNLPEATRVGYWFDGWFTAPTNSEKNEPQDAPEDGEPQDVPEDGEPQDVPGDGGTQDVPEDGEPQDVPEDGEPQDVPEDGGTQDVPEDSKPQDVPEDGEPQDVPEDGEPQDVPEDDKTQAVPKECRKAETQTVPLEGITLYAHWTPREYTVKFNANGGSNAPEDIIVTYDSTYSPLSNLSKPTPKAGERFVGWYTEPVGGVNVTADTIVKITETQTLYAHYKPLVQIKPNWIDFGPQETFTYSKGVSRAATYSVNESDPMMVDTDPDETIYCPTEGFSLVYIPTQGGRGISTEYPVNAGTYQVRVTRPADELYAAFEAHYSDVLKINKANRDLSGVDIDMGNSSRGFNYLVIGATLDDLGPGATVTFNMTLDGKDGISTSDGHCFFYGLDFNTGYTATLTYVSVTGDDNYYDTSGRVNTSSSIRTTNTPSGSWSSHAGQLTTDIRTAADMAALMNAINSGNDCSGSTFTLRNDIDMSAYEWDTTGKSFNGTFDGGGHKIYGLYSEWGGYGDVGLFGKIGSQGRVEDVLLAGGYIRGANRVGGIAGYAEDGAVINNCVNYATVRASGSGETDAGGIVGKVSHDNNNSGTRVTNCVNFGSISGSGKNTGGIIGHQMGTSAIANCANYGSVYGSNACIGGIAGNSYNRTSVVYNCVNAGSVTGSSSYRGAIVGRNDGDDGRVDQGYYLEGSAPDRTAVGSETGARPDNHTHVKCSSFSSYSGVPARVVEEGCEGKTLLQVLNHWANRCWNEYQSNTWTLTGPGGAPVPKDIPKP